MANLEDAWSQAAELASDDAAILNVNDALNLAAALVKLSRLCPVEARPRARWALSQDPLSQHSDRLLAWDQSRKLRGGQFLGGSAIPPVLVAIFCAL